MVVDALSRQQNLLNTLESQILGFDNIMELYEKDEQLASIFASYLKKPCIGFYLSEGYLFNKGKLYIPEGSIRKLLVTKSHERDSWVIMELIKL